MSRGAFIFLTACLLYAGAHPVSGQAPAPYRIDRVETRLEGSAERPLARRLQPRQMPKFMDEAPMLGPYVVDVHWIAPLRNPLAGVTVVLEYRQQYTDQVRRKNVEFQQELTGEQMTRFMVTGDELNRHGPVTAWRVRLVRARRLLAEQVSDMWR